VIAISQEEDDYVGGEEMILEVWDIICNYICHSMLKNIV